MENAKSASHLMVPRILCLAFMAATVAYYFVLKVMHPEAADAGRMVVGDNAIEMRARAAMMFKGIAVALFLIGIFIPYRVGEALKFGNMVVRLVIFELVALVGFFYAHQQLDVAAYPIFALVALVGMALTFPRAK